MKMTVLLVVSTLSLLAISAARSTSQHAQGNATKTHGNHNLNHIIDLAKKYNESLTTEYLVDDVSHLVDAGCQPKFFCKVRDILEKREKQFDGVVRNLKVFLDHKKVNCEVLLKDVTSTGVSIQISELMRHLITCCQHTNFRGSHL